MRKLTAINFFASKFDNTLSEIVVFADSVFGHAPEGCPTGTQDIWEYFEIHGSYRGITRCAVNQDGFLFGFEGDDVTLLSDVECRMDDKYYKQKERIENKQKAIDQT